jgi:carbonic anhydrase
MVDAWAKGQKVRIHGLAFGVHDGLLQDLRVTMNSTEAIEPVYRAAIDAVVAKRS